MIQPWMRGVLLIGAAYNFAWSFFLYWVPGAYIKWITIGKQSSNDFVGIQAVGIAVVGVLMLLAALSPVKRQWALWITLITKASGGLFVYLIIMESSFNKKFLFHLIMNDLVWIAPLILIIIAARKSKKTNETIQKS